MFLAVSQKGKAASLLHSTKNLMLCDFFLACLQTTHEIYEKFSPVIDVFVFDLIRLIRIWPLRGACKTSPLFCHSRQTWHLPLLLQFQPLPILRTKVMHWLDFQTTLTTLLMWRPSGLTSTPSWTD